MRLIKILDHVNQIEKSSFLKILDNFSNEFRKSNKTIDLILNKSANQIRNIDNDNVAQLFLLTSNSYKEFIREHLQYTDFHLGVLTDILIRDGNSMMSREWLSKLYQNELDKLKVRAELFATQLTEDNKDLDPNRKRDYVIFRNCVQTALFNDQACNRESTITKDEKCILNTLSRSLDLSSEEVRLIYFSIDKVKKLDIDYAIQTLKELGIVFFSRRNSTIYVPHEIIWILRELAGVELPNKAFRRILRQLDDAGINRVAKLHNIDPKLDREDKIKQFLLQGVCARSTLLKDIYRPGTTKTQKKDYINDLIINKLDITLTKMGSTYEDRVDLLIKYFINSEQEESLGISTSGYQKLLHDLQRLFPAITSMIKLEFELQQEDVMKVELMQTYNIKPIDILALPPRESLKDFAKACSIKTRGNIISHILERYHDAESLYIENFELFGLRDYNRLRERNIEIRESELGLKYEEITRSIFAQLGFNVDEKLRDKLCVSRGRIDIILNLGNNELVVVECKTVKDSDYNKYSSVARQVKCYERLCKDKGYQIRQSIIVSNDFSDEFIANCEYDYEINLSLLTSKDLVEILQGFKKVPLTTFPPKLFFMRGKLNAERIVTALNR